MSVLEHESFVLIGWKNLLARIKQGPAGGDPKMKADGQITTDYLKPSRGVDPDATDRESTFESGVRFFF